MFEELFTRLACDFIEVGMLMGAGILAGLRPSGANLSSRTDV